MTTDLSPKDLAILAARAVDDKKATDTLIIAVGPLLAVTEYFVITSASTSSDVLAARAACSAFATALASVFSICLAAPFFENFSSANASFTR